MLDDNLKLIFVENPKACSYSIKMALMGHDFIKNPRDERFVTVNHKTPDLIKCDFPKAWNDYLSFVVVRNTWDRAHSFFHYTKKYGVAESYQSLTFDDWVAEGCLAPKDDHLRAVMRGEGRLDDVLDQIRYIKDVDHVIVLHSMQLDKRNEELQFGFDRVMEKAGIDRRIVPVGNSQERNGDKVPWKKETISILGERYKEEIDLFGFVAPQPQN